MSDLDLRDARHYASTAILDHGWAHDGDTADDMADAAIDAAAPLIEQAVREQVAREIEGAKRDWQNTPFRSAIEHAASIARGGAS